jgi:hypothetical protein
MEKQIKDFLYREYANLTQFYSDRESFEKHFYSGEVKIPAIYVVNLIKKFNEEITEPKGESVGVD